jgi:hypothetical protein
VVLSALGSFLPLAALEDGWLSTSSPPAATVPSTTLPPPEPLVPSGVGADTDEPSDDPHAGHVAGTSSASAAAAGTETAEPLVAEPFDAATFRVFCSVSHRAPDDPIVFPGQPGAAHNHDFLGSTATDADVTLEQMNQADSSCNEPGDMSGYWVPTLSYDGEPLAGGDSVGRRSIYYLIYADTVVAPAGLKIVTDGPTSKHWDCMLRDDLGVEHFSRPQDTFPHCPRWPYGSVLRQIVAFPDCWDGAHLDSSDHRSHMAFSGGGPCPDTHPVRVPKVVFSFRYPGGLDPERLELSSGEAITSHGDVLFNWQRQALQDVIDRSKEQLPDWPD